MPSRATTGSGSTTRSPRRLGRLRPQEDGHHRARRWESVKRHFRALGHDTQAKDFSVAGIGDMSGDVFGNGMLLSQHIRLVAAFDHRHVFLDPAPDAAASFRERDRMFRLPRSSWADYDAKLISKGGGIYPRSAKSIPVSPEMREVLGIKAEALAPERPDLGDPARAGRPALQRWHRHRT
jgi:glutamate dehydrogenase